ncbi:MAG: hypothetical protein ACI30B_07805 [Paludibacteraceae bacterium]
MNYEALKQQAYNAVRKDNEMAEMQLQKQIEWQRYLATSATALLGILIALTDIRTAPIVVRVLFSVAVVLLVLSILALSAGLYADIYYLGKGRALHAEEARKAFAEMRQQEYTSVPKKKAFGYCATIGAAGCALALLVLCVYAVLRCFL